MTTADIFQEANSRKHIYKHKFDMYEKDYSGTSQLVMYKITFNDESSIDAILTNHQYYGLWKGQYKNLIKHTGGLGYYKLRDDWEEPTSHLRKISIQIGANRGWDSIMPTFHEVENPGEVAQAIADATGKAVRMTYYNDGTGDDVCRNNGAYLHPKARIIRTKEEVIDDMNS